MLIFLPSSVIEAESPAEGEGSQVDNDSPVTSKHDIERTRGVFRDLHLSFFFFFLISESGNSKNNFRLPDDETISRDEVMGWL